MSTLNMLGQTLRDACAREIVAADAALAASARSPHRRVHQARKALRRARALLALIARDDAAFAAVDARLRRAVHSLSPLRDAAVAVETFARLMKRKALRGSIETVAPLSGDLVRHRDLLLASCRQRDPGFAKLRNHLQRAGEAVKALPWSRAGPREVARGLAHSRRRIDKVEELACHSNGQHLRHRWRRRLRRYNDQCMLIAEIVRSGSGVDRITVGKLIECLSRKGLQHVDADKPLVTAAHKLGLEHDAHLTRQIMRKTPLLDDGARRQLLSALDPRLRKRNGK